MFGKKKKKEELAKVDSTEVEKVEEINDPEVVDKPEDEEKPKKQNPFKNTGFIIKIFSAAVLLALGLWMIFDHDTAEQLVVTVSGASILILCLARIIYLLRAKNLTKRYKITVIIEICIDLVVGLFLIISGVIYQKDNDSDKGYVKFVRNNYRWFVGSVIYLRGVVHFFETGFLKQKTTFFNYVINIVLITLGTFCFAYKFNVSKLAWVITFAVLLSCLYLTQDSVRAYVAFKNGGSNGEKRKSKKKDKKKEESDTIPAGILDQPESSNDAIVN